MFLRAIFLSNLCKSTIHLAVVKDRGLCPVKWIIHYFHFLERYIFISEKGIQHINLGAMKYFFLEPFAGRTNLI
jgi:hypothetical protein